MIEKPAKRRIAVALDASEHSRRALQIIVSIAAALEAEIEGVFVENADLFRLAGLPFLRELRHASVGEDALDANRLQHEMRALARQTRQVLEQSAKDFGVTWSFRVWRGSIEADILDAAVEAEMFALGPIGNYAPFRPGPKSQPSGMGEDQFAIGILYTGSDTSTRALAGATELASRQQSRITVLLQGSDTDAVAKLREKATLLLGKLGEAVSFLPLTAPDSETLAKAVVRSGSDLLLVDVNNPLLDHHILWGCLKTLHCPVLVVR